MRSNTIDADIPICSTTLPNHSGHFGKYGGRYVPETLFAALSNLTITYEKIKNDRGFWSELQADFESFIGRPTPIYHAKRWSAMLGGAQIYLKREDLNHTGAHKINNSLGQIHLARKLGKTRIIAETGAGQHGVATATVAARFGLECVIYMGAADVERQHINVERMQILGAKVIPVTSGTQTLKDALNEAMRDWVTNIDNTYYVIGSVAGPHPYPMLVRDFQAVIGRESRQQMLKQHSKLPDVVIACVGGGSNAIGMFTEFIPDESVRLIAVEAGGFGDEIGEHAATLSKGVPGVLHGSKTYILQDQHGQVSETHSISAGLDYPAVGPELSWLKDSGRIETHIVGDIEATKAFFNCSRIEGIIPALESSHALAYAEKLAKTMRSDQKILVNLSGRGDKDMHLVSHHSSEYLSETNS
ncbi:MULTISPECIES: tryptophan synthase subunit beta [Deefgea]|uniref:Tryptophan synthase beta chain n=1 Tax=Deefgea chitinilytica TaxID=570276 RepID=A0ABS2CFQ9_9NEIS|nr:MULTISPECIES: tryptophan synthase subunit beta [Deefgea]MBM5572999.1 tryptophan synthase subunit beta [Deefgea chitinilytica]MBM9890235.1 tryptophan synthase subunit beta [Deefgea sp. CFH1-16]